MKQKIIKNAFLTIFLILGGFLFAQKSVSGTVTDDEGVPLPGATVLVVETNSGVSTDFDGNYSISVEEGQTLSISFVGYASQETKVGASSSYDFILQSSNALDEVVVTSLGISRQKRELTYAAQNVDSEGIDESRANGNLVNSLQGKVAGISITTTSQGVNSQSRVLLRGNRSISGSSQPLYIVDGVPLGGDIQDFSPDDIASISVLKGANAAALYGARANNGAIIITTKSGKKDTFSVNINSNLTYDTADIMLEFQNEYGQGNGGVYSGFTTDSWGPRMGGTVAHWSPNPELSGTSIPYEAQPDNVKDFFNTGVSIANNISLVSGGENMRTFFSYTNDLRTGIVPNNELERHSINLKIDNDMLDGKLRVSSRINYIKSVTNNVLPGWESYDNPLRGVYRIPRSVRTQDAANFEFTDSAGNNKQNYWKPLDNGNGNPYWVVNRNNNELVGDRIVGFASATYDFTDEISLLVRSAIDNTSSNRESRWWNDSYIIAQNGNYRINNGTGLEWNNDFLLSYDTSFGDLNLKASVGGNNRVVKFESSSINTGGLNAPNIFSIANAQQLSASQSLSEKEVNSLYAFANLGFKNYAFLDLTYRTDVSSTLPVENNQYDYISAGLSAILSDMIDLPSAFDYFKIRASYAEVGNDTDPYQLSRAANLQTGGFIQLDTSAPASDLRPEKTTSLEFGFDTTLFNRINLDFTYYKSNSVDQLFRQNVPQGSGIATKFINGADIENSGIEAAINVGIFTKGDFQWDVNFNYAANRSMVLRLAEGLDQLNYGGSFMRQFKLDVGEPFGSMYSRGFERDAQGRVLMNDNGTPQVTPGQTVNVGNFNPDWLGGLTNNFTYKNLNLRLQIDIRQGGEVISFTRSIASSDGVLDITGLGREGGIRFGTDVYENEIPATTANSVDPETFWTSIGGRNAPVGEAFTYDASNIRIRELTLGYSFDQNMLASSPFKTVKLSLVGRNLGFLVNESGVDPEAIFGVGAQNDGYEAFSLPNTRSVGLNLKLGF
ncbi:SusC/RagA family TonB-linked outer membrane protein [Flavobacteriaceae bacterium]|nr:SusC/RagA family TonB-linked outer membrane protein [Flavobacteriaceae bacterium]